MKKQSNKKINNSKSNNSQGVNLSRTERNVQPKFESGNFKIKKREFIQNILPSNDFKVEKFDFNPGIPKCFPWLSTLALSFEKYIVRRCKFIYEPAQSTFIPGMCMFAPEFNVADPLPEEKSEFLEYAYATRGPVWKGFSMEIPSKSIMSYKDYYTRNDSPLPEGSDRKLYDPFYLLVGVDGVQDSMSISVGYIGELWIEYEIEFYLPQRLPKSTLLLPNTYYVRLGPSSSEFIFGEDIPTYEGDLKVSIPINISNQPLPSLIFSEDFSGMIFYNVWGPLPPEGEFSNLLDDANVTGGSVTGVNFGARGTNLSEGNATVNYIFWVEISAGGRIDFGNNGYSDTSGVTTSGTTILMYNNVFIPTTFTPGVSYNDSLILLLNERIDILSKELERLIICKDVSNKVPDSSSLIETFTRIKNKK